MGETTSLIAEAGTALHDDQIVDGGSGDTDFPYLSGIKPLATVGEYDAVTGRVLTGYPDGQAAWLADEDTIRVAYQSESYATMG
ncbi:MAG: calcium-binding protein, partial [Opitutae bacterium]|nr:calcium-binding protein [Opitutae bacterium]